MRRLLLLFAVVVFGIISVNAQMITHVVKKGETVKSIAKKYGVGISDILNENIEAGNGIFVGMILNIPVQNLRGKDIGKKKVKMVKKSHSDKRDNNNDASILPNDISIVNVSNKGNIKVRSKSNNVNTQSFDVAKRNFKKDSPSNPNAGFSSIGLTFGNYFGDDIVEMTYGLQGQYFLPNRFGVTLGVGTNYGLLEGESDADIDIRLGPSYVFPLTSNLYVMGTACYTVTLAKRNGASGTVSGANIIPTIGYSFGKIKVAANGIVRWRNGGSFGIGAFASICYSIN